jgi:transposase-like protein
VIDEVKQWQNRPLEAVYPIGFLDCLAIKVRDNGRVINKSLYFALGVNMDGHKELLGMWISLNEGDKFWLSVLTSPHTHNNYLYPPCRNTDKGLKPLPYR